MLECVVGFMFSPDLKKVVLLKKNKPDFQSGKWNGPGGKVEPGEAIFDAVVREFEEETGVRQEEWFKFATLRTGIIVYCFCCISEKYDRVKTMEDEDVAIWLADELPVSEMLGNLKFLVPMAQQFLTRPVFTSTVTYNDYEKLV